jgi:hypothetical protein
MLNDSLKSGPTESPDHDLQALHAVAQVLDLLSDPAALAIRVKELRDAATEYRTTLDAVQAESAALDKKRQAHLDLMNDERTAHEDKLRIDRAAFDNECATTRAKLATEREAAKTAQTAAETERTRALTLSNDLESRLAMIQGAASAPLPAQHRQ